MMLERLVQNILSFLLILRLAILEVGRVRVESFLAVWVVWLGHTLSYSLHVLQPNPTIQNRHMSVVLVPECRSFKILPLATETFAVQCFSSIMPESCFDSFFYFVTIRFTYFLITRVSY